MPGVVQLHERLCGREGCSLGGEETNPPGADWRKVAYDILWGCAVREAWWQGLSEPARTAFIYVCWYLWGFMVTRMALRLREFTVRIEVTEGAMGIAAPVGGDARCDPGRRAKGWQNG